VHGIVSAFDFAYEVELDFCSIIREFWWWLPRLCLGFPKLIRNLLVFALKHLVQCFTGNLSQCGCAKAATKAPVFLHEKVEGNSTASCSWDEGAFVWILDSQQLYFRENGI
jgi:hypothetical protein